LTATMPDRLLEIAQTLEQSEDYRILRRLKARDVFTAIPPDQPFKIGALLDVETTGLSTQTDEVIEVGIIKFAFLPDGRVAHVIDAFGSFNEPSKPIPAEVTAFTGITDDMVAGRKIDPAAVMSLVSDAAIVIAHNAAFDRKFAERYWPIFEHKHWGCSVTEIEWRKHGFEGSRLGYLLNGIGLFHAAHRAVDDCRALLEILAHELPPTGRPALAMLLDHARRKTVRIWAEAAPFELKDELRRRGYRWNDGSDGRPRAWYVDLDESLRDAEITYLRQSIYRRDVEPLTRQVTALTRYSNRI
jgi:DNA polymerase-3 subunit epsilon